MIKQVEKDPSLNSTAARIAYADDTGIQRLIDTDGKKQFIYINTGFEIEYFEDLN